MTTTTMMMMMTTTMIASCRRHTAACYANVPGKGNKRPPKIDTTQGQKEFPFQANAAPVCRRQQGPSKVPGKIMSIFSFLLLESELGQILSANLLLRLQKDK